MERDHKLRQEIAQLTHLISSGTKPGRAPVSTPAQAQSSRSAVASYIPRPRPGRNLSFHRNPAASVNEQRYKVVRYPNPFDYYLLSNYSKQVFPTPNAANSDREIIGRAGAMLAPRQSDQRTKPRLDYSYQPAGSDLSNPGPTLITKHISTTHMNPEPAIQRPKSIYINPSHFIKSKESDGTTSFLRIRPYLNPAFKINVDTNPVGITNKDCATVWECTINRDTAVSTSQTKSLPIKKSSSTVSAATIATATATVNSKYKLDRRPKKSLTYRASGPVKRLSNTSPRTKVSKRFSIKFISKLSTTPLTAPLTPIRNRFSQSSRTRKSLAIAHKLVFNSTVKKSVKTHKPFTKVHQTALKGTSKSIVSIDGKRYLSKNGGKTLKRMSLSKPLSLVSIEGRKFIKRNGGKSLKRISETRHSKPKPNSQLNASSPVRTTGKLLANRAIAKSKLTLSQRTWRKKMLCVFYNRFGVCRNHENGKCPYIHDRNHVTICPKFVVGKCVNSKCKLSHDMKVGRMMPCQFFNKSECSRENCPYPHVKLSPCKKSKPVQVKEAPVNLKTRAGSPLKKALSGNKKSPTKKKMEEKVAEVVTKDGKSRYYDQLLSSQPEISMIPRKKASTVEETSSSGIVSSTVSNLNQCSNDSGEKVVVGGNTTAASDAKPIGGVEKSLRERLLSRVSRLRNVAKKKKEPAAPTFLSFSKD